MQILTEPRNALVKQFQRFFQFDGIELVFADDALVVGRRQGARARDRRARPALDHRGGPARGPVRAALAPRRAEVRRDARDDREGPHADARDRRRAARKRRPRLGLLGGAGLQLRHAVRAVVPGPARGRVAASARMSDGSPVAMPVVHAPERLARGTARRTLQLHPRLSGPVTDRPSSSQDPLRPRGGRAADRAASGSSAGSSTPSPRATRARTTRSRFRRRTSPASLHMGHALNGSIQDMPDPLPPRCAASARSGSSAPTTPGIATQTQVERALVAEGTSREELGREAFVERVWQWRERVRRRRSSSSSSGSAPRATTHDERFTLDEALRRRGAARVRRAVREGLHLPRPLHGQLGSGQPARRSPTSRSRTARSPTRCTTSTTRWPSGSGAITIATVRPETMLADIAVAVHPDDERYRRLVGRDGDPAARRAPAADHRRRLRQARVRHRRAEDHARATTPTTSRSAAATASRRSRVIGEDGRMTAEAPERFAG